MQYQGVGNSGFATHADSEDQIGGPDFTEIGDDRQAESEEGNPDGNRLQAQGGPIIKRIRREESTFFRDDIRLGGAYSFANMLKARLGSYPGANKALPGGLNIQEGVKMPTQLRSYYNFRSFDLTNEADTVATDWGFYGVSEALMTSA